MDVVPPDVGRPTSAAPSSRFSADSLLSEEAVVKTMKNPSNGSLMSVKSIKKLWRKSNKNSIIAFSSGSGRASPGPIPQRPGRPSNESFYLPDIPPVPTTPSFGRPPPRQPSHPEHPQPQQPEGGLSVPLTRLSLALPLNPPVQHHRPDPSMTELHFTGESPYPIRPSPTQRYSTHSPSPNHVPPPLPPPVPEKENQKEKMGVRKSILKWKNSSSSSSGSAYPSPTTSEPRSSLDRASSPGIRPRRGSVNNLSPPTVSSEIPPSPRIPEHFLATARSNTVPLMDSSGRQSTRSKMSSVDSTARPRSGTSSLVRSASPHQSMASYRDSQDSGPGFDDDSGFEIVHPHGLSSPYHSS